MSSVFHRIINHVSTRVAMARAAGVTTITVTAGDGAMFGSTFPLFVTAVRQVTVNGVISETILAIFEVIGRSGDVLTISGAVDGTTDADLQVGDLLEMRDNAGAIVELQDAINMLEALSPDKNYLFVQATPSASWTVAHNLAKYSTPVVIDSAGSVVIGAVTFLDLNTVRIDFAGAFSGSASFN